MLFRPRHLPTWTDRVRVLLWPRRSFSRSARYVGWRVMRMAGSPHGLAIGVATGVFVATLPIPGAQLVLAALVAWMLGGNVPAALFGTFWANPLTLPFLWLGSHRVGQFILRSDTTPGSSDIVAVLMQVTSSLLAPGKATLSSAYATLSPVLKPLAVGAIVVGAVSAFLFYWLTLHLIAGYRAERSNRALAPVDPSPSADLTLGGLSGRLT
jgi:uncharacterized protein